MRITVVHRYFWPDTPPYASILRAICDSWGAHGHDVTVLTTQPHYGEGRSMPRRSPRERVGRFRVRRLGAPRLSGRKGAIGGLIGFPIWVAAQILMGAKPAVVMSSTSPPIIVSALASLAARIRGAFFIYHCMDLHPEAGRLVGEFRNPVLYRVLAIVERATMRRAQMIIVLSEDMRSSVLARDDTLSSRVVVLNNPAFPSFDKGNAESPLPRAGSGTRFVFAGNLGRFQALDDIVRAFLRLPAEVDAHLVLMGEGKAAAGLRSLVDESPVGSHRVQFVGRGTPGQARALMETADVGVVSLAPGVIRFAHPSKTSTYLEAGLPLLVVCEEGTTLAQDVVVRGLGEIATSGDVGQAMNAIRRLCQPGSLDARREAVAAYYQDELAMPRVMQTWVKLIDDIEGAIS